MMGRMGQLFYLLMYNAAIQDRFTRWINGASQYSPGPATDSTETAEFMKFTMTRGAAKPET